MPGFADKREQILTRLWDILETVPGILNVYRDRGDVPPVDSETNEPNLPAAYLLDGREHKVEKPLGRQQGGVVPPVLMELEPQIWIALFPDSTLQNVDYGELLSAFRVSVLNLIFTDAQLIAILGGNGQIEYRGCITDMQTGGMMEGQMQLNFAFQYVLSPFDLIPS